MIITTTHFDIIPSSPVLSMADKTFDKIGKEYLLRDVLKEIEAEYDNIIIDTPPAASILTINAMVASNDLIIPAQADIFSIQGLNQIYSCYESIKKYCNSSLKISGILINRYNKRTLLSQEMVKAVEEIAGKYSTKVFSAKIRESIVVKESQANNKCLLEYDPKSGSAQDFIEFIKEYMGDQNA